MRRGTGVAFSLLTPFGFKQLSWNPSGSKPCPILPYHSKRFATGVEAGCTLGICRSGSALDALVGNMTDAKTRAGPLRQHVRPSDADRYT